MDSLLALRKQIDAVDAKLLALLMQRFRLVKCIAAGKMRGTKHDPKREKEMLSLWLKSTKNTDIDPKFIKKLLKLVTDESKKYQSAIHHA